MDDSRWEERLTSLPIPRARAQNDRALRSNGTWLLGRAGDELIMRNWERIFALSESGVERPIGPFRTSVLSTRVSDTHLYACTADHGVVRVSLEDGEIDNLGEIEGRCLEVLAHDTSVALEVQRRGAASHAVYVIEEDSIRPLVCAPQMYPRTIDRGYVYISTEWGIGRIRLRDGEQELLIPDAVAFVAATDESHLYWVDRDQQVRALRVHPGPTEQ